VTCKIENYSMNRIEYDSSMLIPKPELVGIT
jgi:hypothetical protein